MNEPNPPPESPTDTLSETEIEKLLASSTLPPNISICLGGFQTETDANEVGMLVGGFLRLFGTYLNLERLDGVTVAYDYKAALAGIQRGANCSQELAATNDRFAVGVAMAVPVLRDGKPKSHLVLDAALVGLLRDQDNPDHQLAVGLLAHEAAHVHDLLMQDRAFPGFIMQRSVGYREGILLQIANPCWNEYAACRLSARFEYGKQLEWFGETFCEFAEEAKERSNEYIRQYRRRGDLNILVPQIVAEYGGVLKYAAYLLGHLDGLGLSISKDAPKAHELVNRKTYFTTIFVRFAACLRAMWETYGHWSGLEVFGPLKEIADDLLRVGGIEIQERAQGPYVNVPFTSDTIF